MKHPRLLYQTEEFKEFLIEMCSRIIDNIEDVTELRDMLSMTLPTGWDSLYLMSKYKINKLLKNEKVQLVID